MIVWDDRKENDYAFQSEFSYRVNQLDKKKWFAVNIALGTVLALLMGFLLFLVPSTFLSDVSRMIIAVVVGSWPLKFCETKAERSMNVCKAAMAVAFVGCIIAYALSISVFKS